MTEHAMTDSDLNDATNPGDLRAWPSTPGEFAARWNSQTEEWRQGALARIRENADAATRCFIEDHGGVLQKLELATGELVRLRSHQGGIDQ